MTRSSSLGTQRSLSTKKMMFGLAIDNVYGGTRLPIGVTRALTQEDNYSTKVLAFKLNTHTN